MKLIIRIAALFFGAFFLLLGRGMQLDPYEVDRNVGLLVYLTAVALLLFVFFGWKKTALRTPVRPAFKVKTVGILLFVIGILTIISLQALLWLSIFGDGSLSSAIRSVLVTKYEFFGTFLTFAIAISEILVGMSLLLNAKWSRICAKALALPISIAWPLGFVIAVYTWWALNPNGMIVPEPEHEQRLA